MLASIQHELQKANDFLERPSEDNELQTNRERLKNIPMEYYKYTTLFKEELDTRLLEYSQQDHEIYIKAGSSPTFSKIYNLNEA